MLVLQLYFSAQLHLARPVAIPENASPNRPAQPVFNLTLQTILLCDNPFTTDPVNPLHFAILLLLLLQMSRFKWCHHNRCGGTLQCLPIKISHDSWSTNTGLTHHFYWASICEDGLGSRNSVCPYVRLSVTHVDCDKSKWGTADILIPHKSAITLLLLTQQWLVGDAPSLRNLHFKWPTPFEKC